MIRRLGVGLSAWRAAVAALFATLLAAVLAACGSAPPPDRLLRLPLAAAAAQAAPASTPAPANATEHWQLALPIALPAYLDTAAVLVPRGGAGLEALPGVRWAEPLRDAVPRLLQHDLAQLRGEGRLWTAPLPSGVSAAARLRVELLAFEAEADGAAVRLVARWSLTRADASAPRTGSAELRAPVAGLGADAIVLAHRQVLRELAERIAATR